MEQYLENLYYVSPTEFLTNILKKHLEIGRPIDCPAYGGKSMLASTLQLVLSLHRSDNRGFPYAAEKQREAVLSFIVKILEAGANPNQPIEYKGVESHYIVWILLENKIPQPYQVLLVAYFLLHGAKVDPNDSIIRSRNLFLQQRPSEVYYQAELTAQMLGAINNLNIELFPDTWPYDLIHRDVQVYMTELILEKDWAEASRMCWISLRQIFKYSAWKCLQSSLARVPLDSELEPYDVRDLFEHRDKLLAPNLSHILQLFREHYKESMNEVLAFILFVSRSHPVPGSKGLEPDFDRNVLKFSVELTWPKYPAALLPFIWHRVEDVEDEDVEDEETDYDEEDDEKPESTESHLHRQRMKIWGCAETQAQITYLVTLLWEKGLDLTQPEVSEAIEFSARPGSRMLSLLNFDKMKQRLAAKTVYSHLLDTYYRPPLNGKKGGVGFYKAEADFAARLERQQLPRREQDIQIFAE